MRYGLSILISVAGLFNHSKPQAEIKSVKQTHFRRLNQASIFIVLLLTLTACGSNADNNSAESRGFNLPAINDTPLAINRDNEAAVTRAGFEGASGGITSHHFGPYGVAMKTGNTSHNLYARLRNLVQDSVAHVTLNSVDINLVDAQRAGVVLDCPGGGKMLVVIASEKIQTNLLSPNDEIHMVFEQCGAENGDKLNGVMSVAINTPYSVPDQAESENVSFDATVDFSDFRAENPLAENVIVDGDVRLAFSMTGNNFNFLLSGSSVYIVFADDAMRLTNYEIAMTIDTRTFFTTLDSEFTLGSIALNGTVTVDTYLEASGLGTYPDQGYINIKGGSTILVVDVSSTNNVVLTLTENNQIQQGYPKPISWSELGLVMGNLF